MGRAGDLAVKKLNLREQALKFFEPQLIALGLDKEQIENQDLAELRHSLETVNDAIQNPSNFGVFKVSMDAGGGFIVSAQSQFEIGILPLLLESKKLILNRIKRLEVEKGIIELQEKAQTTSDPTDKVRYERQVQELQREVERLEENRTSNEEKLGKAEEALREAQSEIKKQELVERKERFRLEAWERRTRIFQSFLERESVATIVGGLLLIAVTLFLIVFTFINTKALDILSNAFLVILGYFFGQSVGRGVNSQTLPKDKNDNYGEQ